LGDQRKERSSEMETREEERYSGGDGRMTGRNGGRGGKGRGGGRGSGRAKEKGGRRV